MADMTPLATTEQFAALLARIDAKINALAGMFAGDSPVNVPTGTEPVKFNTATAIWEKWNGTGWAPLAVKYGIEVDKAGTVKDNGGAFRGANTGAVALTIPVRDASARLPGSITGDAATVGGLSASDFATAAQGVKADAALPAASYTAADIKTKLKTVDGSGSGIDADTVDGIHGSSIITTSNVGSQSVAYATDAGNATTATNADTVGGKQVSALPVGDRIPVRGSNLFLNELYSASFSSLTAAGITISGLSLQQYGVVDVYVYAKLTQPVVDWLTLTINGDATGANYDTSASDGGLPQIGMLDGNVVTGFVHLRLSMGAGMYCYGNAWSGASFLDRRFIWKSTANVTQLKLAVANARIMANGAKVVICRAA